MSKSIWDRFAPVYSLAMKSQKNIYDYMYSHIREKVRGKDVLEPVVPQEHSQEQDERHDHEKAHSKRLCRSRMGGSLFGRQVAFRRSHI